jgi:peptidoglycan/xylan/chitin deacetylase (PgdA/CDA1 family)
MDPVGITATVAGVASVLTGVGAWGAFVPSSQLFGPTVRRTGDRKTIALTFDDGPNPSATPELLELLGKHGARATFFMIGRRVREFPKIVADVAARGHAVANHTDTHPNLAFQSAHQAAGELARCRESIATVTGRDVKWMRPPFGGRAPSLGRTINENGIIGVVMWSRWARDWKVQPAEAVIERLRRVRGGDIVLLHDGDHRVSEGDRRHTVRAVEYWLPRWKDAGLRFVTVDDWNSKI